MSISDNEDGSKASYLAPIGSNMASQLGLVFNTLLQVPTSEDTNPAIILYNPNNSSYCAIMLLNQDDLNFFETWGHLAINAERPTLAFIDGSIGIPDGHRVAHLYFSGLNGTLYSTHPFAVPNLTLNNTTDPTNPTAGQIYFNGTHFKGYNGTQWVQLDN